MFKEAFHQGRYAALEDLGLEKRALGFFNALGNTAKNVGGAFMNAAGGASALGHMAGATANQSRAGVGTWLGNRAMTAAKGMPNTGAALGAFRR